MHNEIMPDGFTSFGNNLSLRVDGAIGAMSLSPNGRDALLAGRKGLYVIDLEDPFSPPRWLHHTTSWEVADVQWSPHMSKPYWAVSTSNQKALVWNLSRPSNDAIEYVLHGHTRAITDINFHPENPEVLATCAVDTFALCWDLRTPDKPVAKWADWRAGASQVKWNFKNSNVLASSHNNYFYVWDLRMGASPLHKISDAHSGRINGLDFSRDEENKLISCSNDMTVKFWDLEKSQPDLIIRTDFPVSRARQVPFGENACGIMPMRGGNNCVYVVDYTGLEGEVKVKPSYIFKGHTEPVKDFLWRSRHQGDITQFQLVTWGKDCDLRLWPVHQDLYDKLGSQTRRQPHDNFNTYSHELSSGSSPTFVGMETSKDDQSSSSHLNWISGVRMGRSGSDLPVNLGEEVSVVGRKFSKVRFEKISVSTGTLVISLYGPWSEDESLTFLRIEINFSPQYPDKSPRIVLEENRELSTERQQTILEGVERVAKYYAEARKPSLESILRFLMGEDVKLNEEEELSLPMEDYEPAEIVSGSSDSEDDLNPAQQSSFNIDSTPLPKGCGAVWTHSGHLVCFFLQQKQNLANLIRFDKQGFFLQSEDSASDPGSEQGGGFDSRSEMSDESSSDSFTNDWNDLIQRETLPNRSRTVPNVLSTKTYNSSKALSDRSRDTSNKNVVHICDFRHLMPAKMDLAFEYRILGDAPDVLARHNANAAASLGYKDVADCWRIAEMVLVKDVNLQECLDSVSLSSQQRFFPRNEEARQVFRYYWGFHPFGFAWLVQQMLAYFEKLKDVQMLAMLACIFHENDVHRLNPSVPIHTPYVIPLETGVSTDLNSIGSSSFRSLSTLPTLRRTAMSSAQSFHTPTECPVASVEMVNTEKFDFYEDSYVGSLLDPFRQLEQYRNEYASLLYAWGLYADRVKILKFNHGQAQTPGPSESDGRAGWEDCEQHLYDAKLSEDGIARNHESINRLKKSCNYCGLVIRKRLFVCVACEHALHADCATAWWSNENQIECPSGCGCYCVQKWLNNGGERLGFLNDLK